MNLGSWRDLESRHAVYLDNDTSRKNGTAGYLDSYIMFDDEDFKATWDKVLNDTNLPIDTSIKAKARTSPIDDDIQDNLYFHAGLNLDNIMQRKSPAAPKSTVAAAPKPIVVAAVTELPKYGFVDMIQKAFGNPDMLSNNRFMNPSIGEKIRLNQRGPRRVRFSLTEITRRHLPNCRRKSMDSEYGFLHAPKCKNRRSEKELSQKEFRSRANFLETNVIPMTSASDFFFVPEYREDVVEVTPTRTVPPLPLDLKSNAVDSIDVHDKNSPGLRYEANDVEAPSKREAIPLNRLCSTEDSLQCHQRRLNPFSEPPEVKVQPSSPARLKCPIFSDAPIAPHTSTTQLEVPQKNSPSGSFDSGVGMSFDGPDDLFDDMLGALSSESEDDGVDNTPAPSSYGDSDNELSSDSDLGSDLEDILSETILLKSKREPRKMWFKKPENVVQTPDPEQPTTNTPLLPPKEDLATTYINPFKKESTSDPVKMTNPSILATLVCSTKPVATPGRHPQLLPDMDRFLFDTLSPDDLIRSRQSAVF